MNFKLQVVHIDFTYLTSLSRLIRSLTLFHTLSHTLSRLILSLTLSLLCS